MIVQNQRVTDKYALVYLILLGLFPNFGSTALVTYSVETTNGKAKLHLCVARLFQINVIHVFSPYTQVTEIIYLNYKFEN